MTHTYSTDEHPISRLMRYVGTLKPKADTLIRAQSSTEKHSAVKPVKKFSTDAETEAACVQMARAGRSALEICEELGLHRHTFYRYCGVNGIDFTPLSKSYANAIPPSKSLGYKMRELIHGGMGPAGAAKHLKVNSRYAFSSLALVGGAK